MGISFIVPAYNEAENLLLLLPSLNEIANKLSDRYELIVIDAKASSDNTEEICLKNNALYFRQKKEGYGDAFRTGISLCRFEHICVVDSDNSQDISKIPEMYDEIKKGAQLVIGSRYTEGGKTNDPSESVFMSKLLNLCYRIILGFRQKDISTDFRIYEAEKLKAITTVCANFDVVEETLFLLIKKFPKIQIKEIPISYNPRLKGKSKRKLLKFIIDYIRLIFRLIKLKKGE